MKSNRFVVLAIVLVAGALWSTQASAGDDNRFADLDRNQDGYLSFDEASLHKGLAEEFTGLDTNGDGQISKDEWLAGKEPAADE